MCRIINLGILPNAKYLCLFLHYSCILFWGKKKIKLHKTEKNVGSPSKSKTFYIKSHKNHHPSQQPSKVITEFYPACISNYSHNLFPWQSCSRCRSEKAEIMMWITDLYQKTDDRLLALGLHLQTNIQTFSDLHN